MLHPRRILPRPTAIVLALSLAGAGAPPAFAADQEAPPDSPARAAAPAAAPTPPADNSGLADLAAAAASMQSQNATVSLINRLAKRGILTKQDSAELLMMAEADAAEARAQAALTQAAIAMAAAAQARARAIAAQAGFREGSAAAVAAAAAGQAPAEQAPAAAAETDVEQAPASSAQAQIEQAPAPAARTRVEQPPASAAEAPLADDLVPVTEPARAAPRPTAARPAGAGRSSAKAAKQRAKAPPPDDSADAAPVPDDVVRVTYVPEYVKEQLRQEVTQDVLDDARKEGWAAPNALPGWVSRLTLFGDFRLRFEDFRYPNGNDNTGAFPNFNVINTGAPFNVTGPNYAPQFDVDQDRSRFRIRARAGMGVDLGDNFSVGLRLATGNDDQPVSENQTIGAAGSVQGGNFSKYAVWLDRAFLSYEAGGKPDEDVTVSLGRFENPFFSTTMIWADDLGFDGGVVQTKYHFGEDVTPFLTFGAFPVFNTDLAFASNQPAKFRSYDKWLEAAQLGFIFDFGKSVNLKLGVADYHFHNIEGQLSDPFIPLSSADIGDTDESRPAFAQTGNTYMALRDIIASPLNDNGTINQFQYYGLASKFNEAAADARLDFNQFEPFQISLRGEYVKNTAFDKDAISAIAVNNRGPSPSSNPLAGPFVGSGTAWLVRLTLGDAALMERWDWNVNFGYRNVGSDAMVDGFADADFGGGGTNFKGPTFGGSLALSPDVWLRLVWMSAGTVSGPTLKNDILQMDINAKF